MPVARLPLYVLLLVVVLVLAAVLPFVFSLGHLPIARGSSAPWGEFGSYFGGVIGTIFSGLNLVAVTFIAVHLTRLQQNQLDRKRLTLDLYVEWHSDAMRHSRASIEGLIAQPEVASTGIPSLTTFEKSDETRAPHARRVFYFFEKWAMLRQAGELDDRLLHVALGGRADWWSREFIQRLRRYEKDPGTLATIELIESQVAELVTNQRGRE